MTTLFSSQLARIAATSSHELDLRARRTLHAESLLFPRDVAAKQQFSAIFTICHEGFSELCQLDARFGEFERNLFSPQAQEQDRDQMNKSENQALDAVIERLLGLLGSKILLNPAIRTLEWLVRRFRSHVHNTAALILTLLPYHESPVWRNVISIVPADRLTGDWRWIAPYKSDSLNIPRQAVISALTTNDGFWARLNVYIIGVARQGFSHATLIQFWNSAIIEATLGRLSAAKSGRKEVQRQRMEDALLKILPILSDGFDVKGCPDLAVALYTLSMVLAAKAELEDRVLDTLLETVAISIESSKSDTQPAIIAMSVIVGTKQDQIMPKAAIDVLRRMSDLEEKLNSIAQSYSIGEFVNSVVKGTLSSSLGKKKVHLERIRFAEQILKFAATIKSPNVLWRCLREVISIVFQLSPDDHAENSRRNSICDMIRRLNDDDRFAKASSEVTKDLGRDQSELEGLIGETLPLLEIGESPKEALHSDNQPSTQNEIDEALSVIPSSTTSTVSFLGSFEDHLYNQLVECFKICSLSVDTLHRFTSLPLWSYDTSDNLLFFSFLIRISIGPYGVRQRTAALSVLTQGIERSTKTEPQAILTYAIVALSDPSTVVRKAASKLVLALEGCYSTNEEQTVFGHDKIYPTGIVEQVSWISVSHASNIIKQALISALEECVLDASYIGMVVQSALNGPSQTIPEGFKHVSIDLKKSVRHSLLELLSTHAIGSPLLRTKVAIAKLLRGVYKVGSSFKSKMLSPILSDWISLDEASAKAASDASNLNLFDVDVAMASIMSAQDHEAIEHVLSLLEKNASSIRPQLVSTLCRQVQTLWKHAKHDARVSMALRVFELALGDNDATSNGAHGILDAVNLDTDILGGLLENSMSGTTITQNDAQPRKRRRTSHGRESLPPDLAKAVHDARARITLALELTDNAKPEQRPELLPVLFDLLAFLKKLKQQQQLNSPYVLNLCLNCVQSIVHAQKALPQSTIDISAIRADLVIDCIRTSENTQVQSTALLLSASLAALVPDRMLHNVMPVFTFMGQNMLSKEDDHSINIVHQAIDQIVPALINGLRKQNKDVTKSTSGLLASFAAAFDHIPHHRRVVVYQHLLNKMGIDEFAWILVAKIAIRKAPSLTFSVFVEDLMAECKPASQLSTYRGLVQIVNNVCYDDHTDSIDIFDITEPITREERERIALSMLDAALLILNSKLLNSAIGRLPKLSVELSEALRREYISSLQLTLAFIKDCSQLWLDKEVVKPCLDALLGLPSLADLFQIMPEVLEAMSDQLELTYRVLTLLSSKLEGNPSKNTRTRIAAMNFLSRLTRMLQDKVDPTITQAIIICIDRISEVYGRKDIGSVIAAATSIAGDDYLQADQPRIRNMSMLCLASILEVTREAIAPIIPAIMKKILGNIQLALQEANEESFNAAMALTTSLFFHIAFLISDDDLQNMLLLSSEATGIFKSKSSTDVRVEMLSTVARKVELRPLLDALQGKDLDVSREYPDSAELEKLDLLSIAIDVASKSTVVKSVDLISKILLAHLDQRRRTASNEVSSPTISTLETKVSAVTIRFIYKLSDITFRPVFESWIDWATNSYDLAPTDDIERCKCLRQTSLFNLLTHFFNTLKSIVSSYASYIIPVASTILDSVSAMILANKKLVFSQYRLDQYMSLFTLLRSTFTHDADAFFATPAHFTPLGPALVDQLKISSTKSYRFIVDTHIIPSLVALATATIDHPAHHQKLAHQITKLRHSPASAVRLSSIKALSTLTSDHNVGDDFIANTIGVGSATLGDGDATGIAQGGGSSAGELMIYVNEMLEDDDEEVEMEVRKWVQSIREKVGEDVFEV